MAGPADRILEARLREKRLHGVAAALAKAFGGEN
jgi:hypothetical protein